jgi:uncharacterized protein (DUF1778 family)
MLDKVAKKPAAVERDTLSFKVTVELKAALEKAAAQDDRTLSSLVQHLLAKAMRERGLLK